MRRLVVFFTLLAFAAASYSLNGAITPRIDYVIHTRTADQWERVEAAIEELRKAGREFECQFSSKFYDDYSLVQMNVSLAEGNVGNSKDEEFEVEIVSRLSFMKPVRARSRNRDPKAAISQALDTAVPTVKQRFEVVQRLQLCFRVIEYGKSPQSFKPVVAREILAEIAATYCFNFEAANHSNHAMGKPILVIDAFQPPFARFQLYGAKILMLKNNLKHVSTDLKTAILKALDDAYPSYLNASYCVEPVTLPPVRFW